MHAYVHVCIVHMSKCVHIYACERVYTSTLILKYSRRQKKFPPSIRNTGARLQKTGGERGMNGNGTGDERTTVLYVRIPFHFNFPVPLLSAQARLHAYYIYNIYRIGHIFRETQISQISRA